MGAEVYMPDLIRRKIKEYQRNNYGKTPRSIVVSRDVMYALRAERRIYYQLVDDLFDGILISELQGEKNNQILLF